MNEYIFRIKNKLMNIIVIPVTVQYVERYDLIYMYHETTVHGGFNTASNRNFPVAESAVLFFLFDLFKAVKLRAVF